MLKYKQFTGAGGYDYQLGASGGKNANLSEEQSMLALLN